ncbi:MAG: cupin domain-containing protein [Sulfuriferula multivorans]|uniref:Cupin domain-containing protein n=1 Tax=Sulfuriferula multivorans TaxID=1559896 RepID=A0A7C9P6T9_9PROT|nr:cupin domain-containing protein [Sulfuriferula multivorans]
MRRIKIEAHPDATRLSKLKVNVWPEWEKESSIMPWTYVEAETSYILEGRAIITPEEGEPVEICKGNLVTFPAGMSCVWNIIEPVRKRYRIG